MKKLIALILSAAVLVSLFSACGNVEPEESTTATTTAQTTEAETTVEVTASESTTTEVTSETEGTSATTTEGTVESEPLETEPAALPATPESIWNGAEELYVCAVLGYPHTTEVDDTYAFCQYAKCFITDPEILEKVKSYLSEDSLIATEQEGGFGRGSHNFCIGSSHERNFKVVYFFDTGVDALFEKTYVFCDGEKSNNYIISDEGREYIGSIISECAIGSVELGTEFSDRSEWGTDSGERAFVTISLDSVKGFETDIVDRFEFVYDIREQCILDGFYACLSPENMAEGSVLPGMKSNFSVELPDGRIYNGYCFIGENGRLSVDDILFIETDGETEVFVLNEDAANELSELVESFSVMSATKWEIE